jgi:signal transduction histidine kinase
VSGASSFGPTLASSARVRPADVARAGAFISTLAIAALGAGASLLLWQEMEREQTRELERDAAVIASSLAHVIGTRIEEQHLDAMRRWVSVAATAADSKEWHDEASVFLADHSGFSAVARVRDGAIQDLAVSGDGRETLRALEPRIAELMRRGEAPSAPGETALGPIRLPDGRVVLALRVATPSDTGALRSTLALFVPGVSLGRLLEQRARGYAIRVLCGTEEIYRNADAERDAPGDRFWAVETVRLSAGPDWSVMVHATELLAGDGRRLAPVLALVAGLLISALIASLVHVSQTSRTRAAALAYANLGLRERIQATSHDEAEIRRLNAVLEGRVEERTAALQETIAELETFNYSVSHDLRSPLGAILNFAAILSEDYGDTLDATAREYLRCITSGATGVVSLMDGLLAFSRSGREEIHKARVDVRRLVEGLRDEQLAARGESSCKFQIGALPPAYADPAMLRLIFSNLISNACKFVRRGDSPRVEIGGKVEGGDVVYFVRDEGIGFDMRFAEKLFGVFERLHASEEYEGHGVGLAIVARMVRRHGGRTWAEGALGKGATFYIKLPAQDGRDGRRAPLYV